MIDVQVNGLTIGLLLLGTIAFVQNRPNWATACVVLACLVKAYVISFALVSILLYPRQFLFRFPAIAVLGLALPFAFQRPDYVLRQYELWIQWGLNNRASSEFEDLWFLLARMRISLNQHVHSIVQMVSAMAVAFFCLRRRLDLRSRKQLMLRGAWIDVRLDDVAGTCDRRLHLCPSCADDGMDRTACVRREGPVWQRLLALSGVCHFHRGPGCLLVSLGRALNGIGTFPLTAILTVAAVIVAELRSSPSTSELAAGRKETISLPFAAIAVRKAPPGKNKKRRKGTASYTLRGMK